MSAKRFFFVVLGLLFVAVAIGIAGFYWSDQQLKTASLTTASLLAERDAAQKRLDDLQSIDFTSSEKDTAKQLIGEILPSEKKQENLIVNIINTATTEAGIPPNNIVSISFTGSGEPDSLSGAEKSKEESGVYYYPFSLTIKNISYETLLKLFRELEKNKRIIQADQVQISPDKAKPGALTNVTLTLRTYIKP